MTKIDCKLSACHPEVFTDTWKQYFISVKHKLFNYVVTFTCATCFDSFLSHLQALFIRYRSLLPTLKMHYGIPNAYNFLWHCIGWIFDHFHYMDRVHSLHILKWSTMGAIFIKRVWRWLKMSRNMLPMWMQQHNTKGVFDCYIILFSKLIDTTQGVNGSTVVPVLLLSLLHLNNTWGTAEIILRDVWFFHLHRTSCIFSYFICYLCIIHIWLKWG